MKEAFEKIKERLKESGKEIYREPTINDPRGCSLIPTGEKDILVSKAIEIVNQVAEEFNQGWIPCSERLPEVPEGIEDSECPEFNVTIKGAKLATTLKYAPDGTWFDDDGEIYGVVAWRPLPELYSPKGE